MKVRYFGFILLLFLILPKFVSAADYVIGQTSNTCQYQDGSYILEYESSNLATTMTLGTIRYYKEGNIENPIWSYDGGDSLNHYINWNTPINELLMPNEIYATTYLINQKIVDATLSENGGSICPETIYVLEYEKSEDNIVRDLYACGNNYGYGNNSNTCPATEKYLKEKASKMNYDGTNGKVFSFDYSVSSIVTGDEDEEPNLDDAYATLQENIEKYCNEELDTYDEEECRKAQNIYESTTSEDGQFADFGADADELHSRYLSSVKLDFETGACESYLGNVLDDGKDALYDDDGIPSPAYMLNFAFNIIKYIAIVLLFVFTIVELAKAVFDGKDETRKKVIQHVVKRVILVVIIFFLPMLINFILSLLGIITTDSSCHVGEATSDSVYVEEGDS